MKRGKNAGLIYEDTKSIKNVTPQNNKTRCFFFSEKDMKDKDSTRNEDNIKVVSVNTKDNHRTISYDNK